MHLGQNDGVLQWHFIALMRAMIYDTNNIIRWILDVTNYISIYTCIYI